MTLASNDNWSGAANGRTIRGFDYTVYGIGAMGRTLSLAVRRDF